MNPAIEIDSQDLRQAAERGISRQEIDRQLELFRRPPAPLDLDRPCRPGDGVRRIPEERRPELLSLWEEAAAAGRIRKLVPASGAATRMFRSVTAYRAATGGASGVTPEQLRERAANDADARAVLTVVERLGDFAFHGRLEELAARSAGSVAELVERRGVGALLDLMLEPDGLDLARRPKGLIEFHRYDDGPRTPFEEHFVEGAGYAAAGEAPCRIHFTVGAEHRPDFEALFAAERAEWRERCGRALELELSVQDPATDTLAVDPDDRPFRDDDGRLLFRPAGHGSLIRNLGALAESGADLVLIKNIDNIAHARLHPVSIRWKRLLAGYLLELEGRVHALLEALDRDPEDAAALARAEELLASRIAWSPPDERSGDRGETADATERSRRLRDRLHRPIRVCGVVANQGEPGGGPFWVRGRGGELTGQIVEGAQVETGDETQRRVWESSTHFNPVDLACSLRDHRGEPYDLERYVDSDAVIIAGKTHGGRPLKALERPGLWNGAMAGWNTVFVEVPIETFNPVKTVLDLLRPAHQPG